MHAVYHFAALSLHMSQAFLVVNLFGFDLSELGVNLKCSGICPYGQPFKLQSVFLQANSFYVPVCHWLLPHWGLSPPPLGKLMME
jgi:hypothetical protein